MLNSLFTDPRQWRDPSDERERDSAQPT